MVLVYWVDREEMTSNVQMERWDGTVLDINATCADLGPQCLQLLGMHAISGCDTTSYPYAKGKFSALKTMFLTRFNKIATQGAPQMAVDKEANSLSRVYAYSMCSPP